MAREESDREDLIREATALVERVEYRVDFLDESVVVGFRRDGSISFYFGQGSVFQFNSDDELRRGYLAGTLLKADQGRLVRLNRNRVDGEVQLVRHELCGSEELGVLTTATETISALRDGLGSGSAQILRSVSSESGPDANERVVRWLTAWDGQIKIASTPRLVRPKKRSATDDRSK